MVLHALLLCLSTLAILCSGVEGDASSYYEGHAHILDEHLGGFYEKTVIPVLSDGSAITVDHHLTLNRIVDLDVERQILTLNVWESISWHDERLAWDHDSTKAEDDINKIAVPAYEIWIPDIVLYNSAGSQASFPDSLAIVMRDGTVMFIPPSNMRSYCPVDHHIVANETVTCRLTFGSWVHSKAEMDLSISNKSLTDDFSDDNRDWELVGTTVTRTSKIYECCPEAYVSIHYDLELKRKDHK